MSNIPCTCIIPYCKFFRVIIFAEPRFIGEHLLSHDEEELKEIAIRFGVVKKDTILPKQSLAQRLFQFCRLRQ